MSDDRKNYCEGNQDRCTLNDCRLFGTLGRPGRDGSRRVRGCGDPVARGKNNRRKGDSKARIARKKLGLVATGHQSSRHEEDWTGFFRVEVKAGLQVNPIWTRFQLAFNQSKASKSLGDNRPFAMIAMPDGTKEGVVLMTLTEFAQLTALLTQTEGAR